jgi:hypothetical protein
MQHTLATAPKPCLLATMTAARSSSSWPRGAAPRAAGELSRLAAGSKALSAGELRAEAVARTHVRSGHGERRPPPPWGLPLPAGREQLTRRRAPQGAAARALVSFATLVASSRRRQELPTRWRRHELWAPRAPAAGGAPCVARSGRRGVREGGMGRRCGYERQSAPKNSGWEEIKMERWALPFASSVRSVWTSVGEHFRS